MATLNTVFMSVSFQREIISLQTVCSELILCLLQELLMWWECLLTNWHVLIGAEVIVQIFLIKQKLQVVYSTEG